MYDRVCRFLRFLPQPQSRDTYQVWTTTLNGASPRLLGVKDIKVQWTPAIGCFGPGRRHEGGVSHLAWTVNAKAVSFTYENSLYTMAAE